MNRSNSDAGQRQLRRDIRLLQLELTYVLRRYGDPGLLPLSNRLQHLTTAAWQGGDASKLDDAASILRDLSVSTIEALIRAMACRFDLINLAEDRHRIRVLRQREGQAYPQPRQESLGDAINSLVARGLSADAIQKVVDRLIIEPVFTAHPTEAKRTTVRNTLRRIRHDLLELQRGDMLPRERSDLLRRIRTNLDCLWETDLLRDQRPTVFDEVRRQLYIADSLWSMTPRLMRDMRQALARVAPTRHWTVPAFVRFGSWIGGDRDGHPFVTSAVTKQTFEFLRASIFQRHLDQCDRLMQVITISSRYHSVSDELNQAIRRACERWPRADEIASEYTHARYRMWLAIIKHRVEETARMKLGEQRPAAAYASPAELLEDLRIIQRSLVSNGHIALAESGLQDWIDRLRIFGFALCRLDIRENSLAWKDAVLEIIRQASGKALPAPASDEEWIQLLREHAAASVARSLKTESLADQPREVVSLFKLLEDVARDFGVAAIGCVIISMTHYASDVLATLWLLELAAALQGRDQPLPLPVVPLFETINDLQRSQAILERVWADKQYQQHLARLGNNQVCMIGYSDSAKDGGYLAANFHLYQCQEDLSRFARQRGVDLVFFHGRGGSIGRGGGPAARSITALPHGSVNGRLRVTEQGEVIAERYDDAEIALRHLEQLCGAAMQVSADGVREPAAAWTSILHEAAASSIRKYHKLIETEGFVEYFRLASPIAVIEALPIASRPARRRGEMSLANLRAIPFTFAWTQNRHVLTGFYGLGTGLEQCGASLELLREMYERWPFFHSVIRNAELALIRFRADIARRYAELAGSQGTAPAIWQDIEDEYRRTRALVLAISGQEDFLQATPWFQRSFRFRTPDIDLLNLIQIELIRRQRLAAEDPAASDDAKVLLDRTLRLSVQAIASGLRTTG